MAGSSAPVRRFHHATTDSTNERALAALTAGTGRHLDVHVADVQTEGRGRRGRPWLSTPGEGLFLSLIWCPPSLASGAALTVAAGLGTLSAVRSLGLSGVHLKWPNDLVLGSAKLAGVLVETRGLSARSPAYVVGVGLNVGQESFPGWLVKERPVTSLALAGLDASLDTAEQAVVEQVQRSLGRIGSDPEGLARDYLTACNLEGSVVASTGEESVEGELVCLDLEVGLLLKTAKGQSRLPLERLRDLKPARDDSSIS